MENRLQTSAILFFVFVLISTIMLFSSESSAQKVGIGSVVFAPQNMLDVKGAMVIGNTYSGVNVAPANGLLVEGNVGLGTVAPTQKLDVVGNIKFSGALMPNNLPGTSGYVLRSTGAGTAPTWAVKMSGVSAVERWYYPPFDVNAWTVYTVTATGVTGCTWQSQVSICLAGDWGVQPDVTIEHIEARTGEIKFRLSNNSLTTTYLGMDFNILLVR